MNKKLLTAAIGAALVAGPMMASAAGPTVYGNLHLSVDRIENSAGANSVTAPENEQGFVSSNNSDFGIRGDDDLGGGLKSLYQVQAGAFAADTGASGFSGTLQDTFVGLAGGFGTVRIGHLDTPMKGLRTIVDGYGTRVGDARNVIGGTGTTGGANASLMSFDARINNSVRYDSPSLAGVVVSAHYGSGEAGAMSSTNSDVMSIGATWTGGPIKVGAAYETHNTELVAGNPDSASDEKNIRVAASFGFGPATVGAFYETMSDLAGVNNRDKDIMGVTGAFKFGNNTARLQYFVADETKDATATTQNGGSLLALGIDHALSKNTAVYAIYAVADNDTVAGFKVSGAGAHGDSLTANAGAKQSGLTAGMRVGF